MSEDGNYEVEAIRKWRYNMKLRRKEYLIKWFDYPEDQNTWEPEEHLNCTEMIKRFRKSLKVSERQYLDCKHPERLTGLQRNAEIIAMYGRYEKGRPSTSASDSSHEATVAIYLTFEDEEDTSERVDLDELRDFRPDKAFEFIEQRLIEDVM